MDDSSTGALIALGMEALQRYAWAEARDALEAALTEAESGDIYYGLARAARWLHDEDGALKGGERAFECFQREGARGRAAIAAIELALDILDFRGQTAVANGWLERARRLLDGAPLDPAHGWLVGVDAYLALMLHNDSSRCIELADQAVAIAEECGPIDIEMVSRAIKGLALVTTGQVDAGMSLLDEASTAALGTEVTDPTIRSTILCLLMDACDRVRDFDRASQWFGRIQEAMERWGMLEVIATCRPHYAVVLTWCGDWTQAEAELMVAIATLTAIRPPHVVESVVRLAELRVRQGRLEEAASLFAQVEHEGLAQLGRAALALEQDDPGLAYDLASRCVRRIPKDDRVGRGPGLEMVAHAALACGNLEEAAAAAAELHAIAEQIPVGALRAAATLVDGLVTAALGDPRRARELIEDAVDLYGREGAPFETARARVELGRVLRTLEMPEAAAREWRRARASFDTIGAAAQASRLAALLEGRQRPPVAPVPAAAMAAGLSVREAEVLRLVARGYSNREIADELVLSVRTVERHITNIYNKLEVTGRTARAAVTAHAYRLGLLSLAD